MPKSFTFRFAQVLEIRRLKEDLARRELAIAQQAVRGQSQRMAGLLSEESEGKEAIRGLKKNTIDVVQLRLQEDYRVALERRIREAAERLRDLGKVEAAKRQALTEARKEVRVLEKYRERQLKSWQAGQDLAERKFLDEVSQNMAGMES